MNIVIQSYKRVGNQETLDRLPVDMGKHKVYLCVPQNEVHDHKTWWYTRDRNFEFLPHSSNLKGLSRKRQWIAEYAIKNKWDNFCLMDDDLTLYERKSPDDWHLAYIQPERIPDMFDLMEEWLKDFPAVGISCREGNNREEKPYDVCSRMCRLFAFNTSIFKTVKGLKFRELHGMEDFGITLELLSQGYPNFVSYHFAQGQPGSNTPGGCAEWRTLDTQAEAAHWLGNRYPNFVTVVKKNTVWEGMVGRTDVRVYWKKAFLSTGKELPEPPAKLW